MGPSPFRDPDSHLIGPIYHLRNVNTLRNHLVFPVPNLIQLQILACWYRVLNFIINFSQCSTKMRFAPEYSWYINTLSLTMNSELEDGGVYTIIDYDLGRSFNLPRPQLTSNAAGRPRASISSPISGAHCGISGHKRLFCGLWLLRPLEPLAKIEQPLHALAVLAEINVEIGRASKGQ